MLAGEDLLGGIMPFCQGCGSEVQPAASVCLSCGRALAHAPPTYSNAPPPYAAYGGAPGYAPVGPPPPNYLVQSILTALFCCQPVGIVAIVFAAQVGSKHASGDMAGAMAASKNAKLWSIIAFVAALIPFGLWILFFALSVAFAAGPQ